jgi:hypothetical protein
MARESVETIRSSSEQQTTCAGGPFLGQQRNNARQQNNQQRIRIVQENSQLQAVSFRTIGVGRATDTVDHGDAYYVDDVDAAFYCGGR